MSQDGCALGCSVNPLTDEDSEDCEDRGKDCKTFNLHSVKSDLKN